MAYDVLQADELDWEERDAVGGGPTRHTAAVTDAGKLTESRARMWRYPPHTRGRRHVDRGQEEVFVPIKGTLTLLLEDPPERVDVAPGGVVCVHRGTPLQLRNEGDEELLLFAYGAPSVSGETDFLDDVAEA